MPTAQIPNFGTLNTKLDHAISAVRSLPPEDQDAIVTELLTEVSFRTRTALTEKQRAIVADRLQAPRDIASPEAVHRVTHKY